MRNKTLVSRIKRIGVVERTMALSPAPLSRVWPSPATFSTLTVCFEISFWQMSGTFVSDSGAPVALGAVPAGSVEALRASLASPPDAEALAGALEALRPGGALRLEGREGEAYRGALLLAGFVDVTVADTGVEGRKPEWSDEPQQLPGGAVWRLDEDDLMEDDLVDENDLLDDVEEVGPGGLDLSAVPEEACGPAKPPCANCVCGRADAVAEGEVAQKKQSLAESGAAARDAEGKLVVDTIKLKKAAGGCGSCALGDAFRCAGCPSRGLPAYTLGEKIVIDLE